MKILAVVLAFLALFATPAIALDDEPLSFKVKYQVKRAALFMPRLLKFVIWDDGGFRESASLAWDVEALNIRCVGGSWRDFEFWSWGDGR